MRRSLVAAPRGASGWRLVGRLALALLLLAVTSRVIAAQSVRGEIIDRETGRPVSGAVVLLLDANDRTLAGMIADSAGRFLLRAPAAGSYRLQAQRVGFRTATAPLTLEASVELPYRLMIDPQAIALDGLIVESRPRCTVRPQEGVAAHTLWEEARKALNSALWGERNRQHQFRVRLYERELDRQKLMVQRQQSRFVSGPSSTPFRSAPVETLVGEGFIETTRDGYIYYAPDAEVLLSPEFLDTHCFRVVRARADTALIGLGFEPVRDAGTPDVTGVLWLDRGSSELRHLEYGYAGAPQGVADDRLGGRVEFYQLPTGAWIVQRWYVRMPLVRAQMTRLNSRSAGPSTRRVAIKEDGGEVVSVRTPEGRFILMGQPAALRGVVYDSLRLEPLRGARVYLQGTEYGARSGADDEFEVVDLPEGVYNVAFMHPRLDSLGLEPRRHAVSLGEGEQRHIHLGIPSAASIERAQCEGAESAGGILYGTVLQEGAAPVPGAQVRLLVPRTFGSARGDTVVEQSADARGRFRFCGIPPNTELTLDAEFGGGRSGETQVMLTAGEVVRQDLEMRGARLPDGTERLPATARGRVVEDTSGRPLPGARVWLRYMGTDELRAPERQILSRGRLEYSTNSQGYFSTRPLPVGPYEIVVERNGYHQRSTRVVLTGDAQVEVTITLVRESN